MPDLEVDIIIFDDEIVGEVIDAGPLKVEVDIGSVHSEGTVTDIEVAEVQLPSKIAFEDTVRNAGNAPALMVLTAAAPVPPGTPAGTVILRKP